MLRRYLYWWYYDNYIIHHDNNFTTSCIYNYYDTWFINYYISINYNNYRKLSY